MFFSLLLKRKLINYHSSIHGLGSEIKRYVYALLTRKEDKISREYVVIKQYIAAIERARNTDVGQGKSNMSCVVSKGIILPQARRSCSPLMHVWISSAVACGGEDCTKHPALT